MTKKSFFGQKMTFGLGDTYGLWINFLRKKIFFFIFSHEFKKHILRSYRHSFEISILSNQFFATLYEKKLYKVIKSDHFQTLRCKIHRKNEKKAKKSKLG